MTRMVVFFLGALLLLALSIFAKDANFPVRTPLKHPLDENPAGSPTSAYRGEILKWLAKGPQIELVGDERPIRQYDPDSIRMIAYETEGNRFAIGVGQGMVVRAPLDRVRAVLDDFDHYKELFFTFKDVKLTERDENLAVTAWEQSIPLPFIPNTRYKLYYFMDTRRPERAVYRYQLKESNSLKYSDGVIVLDRIDDANTLYTEYDFYDAHWGIATTFAPGRIWGDSLRDIYYSDVAIRYKVEHPDWSYDKIEDECKANYKKHKDEDAILKAKKKFSVH